MKITVLWSMRPYILIDILCLPNLHCSYIFMVEEQSHVDTVYRSHGINSQATVIFIIRAMTPYSPMNSYIYILEERSACIIMVEEKIRMRTNYKAIRRHIRR
jgi:hypothetical protein